MQRDFFIPRLSEPWSLLLLLISSQLLALLITLANPNNVSIENLIYNSLFIYWNTIITTIVICIIRPVLLKISILATSILVLLLMPAITYALTAFLHRYLAINISSVDYLRFSSISFIIGAIVLRAFYLNHQYHQLKQAELNARIESLQARIRPHFLFNSLNSVIGLMHIDVKKAEQAILNLADIFRASLANAGTLINFADELKLAKSYITIEQYRFGPKLNIEFDCNNVPNNTPIAQLTLQPLLENAILHGVQNMTESALITLYAAVENNKLVIKITNPYIEQDKIKSKSSHALANIEMRIKALFGDKSTLTTYKNKGKFHLTLKYPIPPII